MVQHQEKYTRNSLVEHHQEIHERAYNGILVTVEGVPCKRTLMEPPPDGGPGELTSAQCRVTTQPRRQAGQALL